MPRNIIQVSIKKDWLSLHFHFHLETINLIKTIPGRVWDGNHQLWYIPLTMQNWSNLSEMFPHRIVYLPMALIYPLRFHLKMKNYSQETIKAYCFHLKSFFTKIKLQPDDVTEKTILDYIYDAVRRKNLSISTTRQMVHAFTYYFTFIKPKHFVIKIPLPKKERRLPEILSEKEILQIIHFPANPKHKLLLKLAYASGLRVSELVGLKWSDIDLDRQVLHIRQGKGKKDRISILSQKMESWLREYKKSNLYYEDNAFLFPGQLGQKHLHIRTAQKIFENIVLKAGIQKKVSIHSLRHAFATHMLEQGTDIRYIQFLLGHKSLKTTQIYTHIAKTTIANLRSPFDRLLD